MRGGGLEITSDRRLVDDGKSWYSEGSCISVIYLNRGGSLREGRVPDSRRFEAGG